MAEFDPDQPFEEVTGPKPVAAPVRAEFFSNQPSQVAPASRPKAEFDPDKPFKEVKQDNRPMSGIMDSLVQGIGSGFKGVGQTAGSLVGMKPEVGEQSPASAPYEMRDLWEPSRALAKTAYGLGHSAPTLATGIAGGVAGAAAGAPFAGVGAVPGGIIGGSIGAGLGTVVQSIGPVFAEELKKNPDDPEAAWNNALKHSSVSGAASALGWAAFPLKFLNGPIKNMIFQAAGIQPGIAVADKAVHNIVDDKPITSDLGQAYIQGGIGTVIPMAGHASVKLAGQGVKKTFGDALSASELFRDIQKSVTPMAAEGALTETRAAAKDFANDMRQAQYHWHEMHERLKKVTTPEERKAMWEAADAESVAMQQGMAPADIAARGIGSSTLPPRLQRMLGVLQQDSQRVLDEAKRVGIFEGEGLPSYVPRIVAMMGADGAVSAPKTSGPPQLKPEVSGLSTTTPQMKGRRHLTVEETEAAAKAKLGTEAEVVKDISTLPMATARLEQAVAGRELINQVKEIGTAVGRDDLASSGHNPGGDWFTINHPAFTTYRVRIDPKTNKPVLQENGNPVFDRVPLYVHKAFEGPLRAVLHSGENSKVYNSLMNLKAAATTAIMYSPLIHNAVEWGRALPAMPGKVASGYIYFKGNKERNKPGAMETAVSEGLVPIGRRFGIQDITGVMEDPNMAPGRSYTSKILAAPIEGLFGKTAGDAVKRGVDKAGDFWHGTMLWDRIADLQFGLYHDFKAKLIRKGFDEQTAGRTAAHLANRYAGALPMELMSESARKLANLTMFSRSFTLGNIGAMKDAINGLPRDVQAQIMRDAGPLMHGKAVNYAKRKARQILMMDMALAYAMNTALQSGVRMAMGTTGSQIGDEYLERMHKLLQKTKENPLDVLAHPFASIESLTEMAHNEPSRKDRVLIGYQDDGTAIYGRNPAGKIGEEFIGWLTSPLEMAKKKISTTARPVWQMLSNDKGFGRKVYNPHDPAYKQAWNIVTHFMEAQTPAEPIKGAWELATGQGTPDERRLNLAKTLGPLAGVTFSKGAPGGPHVGEMYHARDKFNIPVQEALPDIRKMIKRGKMEEAVAKMTELKMDANYQRYIVGTTLNPSKRVSKRGRDTLYRTGDAEAIENFERSLRRGPLTQP